MNTARKPSWLLHVLLSASAFMLTTLVSAMVLVVSAGKLSELWFPDDPHGVGIGLLVMISFAVSVGLGLLSTVITWIKFRRD